MSVTASLSKEAITDAFSSSQYADRGETYWDVNLFAKNLGKVVLEQFEGIRLIGEIERIEGKETYDVLSSVLCIALSKASLWNICHNGSAGWRAILSLYFVWTGIFSYGEESGHDLWPPVLRGLGLEPDGNLSNRCGQMFMQCVKENKLEEFVSISGSRYRTRILLHGLIPQRHIDRFIVELIEPELQSHIGVYTTGEHLVRKWTQNGMFRYLPRPIQRFVEYGDPANVNIAERFLDMASRWDEDEPALWRQWGLPLYMVDAFRRHVKGRNGTLTRKSWSGTFKERPYLYFDLQQAEVPLLHIPAQQTKSAVDFELSWTDLKGIERDIGLQMSITSFDGIRYSGPQDLDVGPCAGGLCLEATDRSSGSVTRQSIQVPIVISNNGERIPLYIFNRSTGKLLDPGGRGTLPEELLLVFPKDSALEIRGGRLSSESEKLSGLWSDWQYALCTLEGDGAFEYLGTDAEFAEEISAEIRFSCSGLGDNPELEVSGQAPWWLRCLEGWPIYTDLEKISVACPEINYPVWRRAFGKLTRRDKAGFTRPFDLDFRKVGEKYEAGIPFSPQWEPGVYEIHLRGPLGIEDLILPFVYFPLSEFDQVREPETGLVSEFRLHRHRKAIIQPLFRTTLYEDNGVTIISLQSTIMNSPAGKKLFAVSAWHK